MRGFALASVALALPFVVAPACSDEGAGGMWTAIDSGTNGSSSSGSGSGASGTSGSSSGQTGGASGSGSSSSGGSSADGGAADSASESAVEAGAPCSTDPGMALQFQGQTPDLVQANIAKLPIGRASRTIELWAWFDGSGSSWVNEHGLFQTGDRYADDGGNGNECHEFALNSTAWGPGQTLAMLHPYGNCDSVDNFFNLPADTFPPSSKAGWVHISFGYDMSANNFQFTINGNPMLDIGTGAGAAGRTHPENDWPADPSWTTTSYPAGNLLSIGTTPQFAGPTGWQGKIDELRVWSVFRTAQEIQANMRVMLKGNEPGLVAYYKFDEGTGTTMADATGDPSNAAQMIQTSGYPMTPPTWVVSDIPGPFTCAP
jgi:hypothetical protein